MSIKEIEVVVENLKKKKEEEEDEQKLRGTDGFTGDFYWLLKKGIKPILNSLFPKKRKHFSLISFITLNTENRQDPIRKLQTNISHKHRLKKHLVKMLTNQI